MYVSVTCSSKLWLLWGAEIALHVSKACDARRSIKNVGAPHPQTEHSQLELRQLQLLSHSLIETVILYLVLKHLVFAVLQTLKLSTGPLITLICVPDT